MDTTHDVATSMGYTPRSPGEARIDFLPSDHSPAAIDVKSAAGLEAYEVGKLFAKDAAGDPEAASLMVQGGYSSGDTAVRDSLGRPTDPLAMLCDAAAAPSMFQRIPNLLACIDSIKWVSGARHKAIDAACIVELWRGQKTIAGSAPPLSRKVERAAARLTEAARSERSARLNQQALKAVRHAAKSSNFGMPAINVFSQADVDAIMEKTGVDLSMFMEPKVDHVVIVPADKIADVTKALRDRAVASGAEHSYTIVPVQTPYELSAEEVEIARKAYELRPVSLADELYQKLHDKAAADIAASIGVPAELLMDGGPSDGKSFSIGGKYVPPMDQSKVEV